MGVVEVPLYNGGVALIDEEDRELVSRFRWRRYTCPDGVLEYAESHTTQFDGVPVRLRMHRLILDAKPGEIIDHRDRDGLNCTRANIRKCTHAQNMQNAKISRMTSNPYRGVKRAFQSSTWHAYIRLEGRQAHLGSFKTAEEAGRAYDDAARRHFGEFARLNFPIGDEQCAL